MTPPGAWSRPSQPEATAPGGPAAPVPGRSPVARASRPNKTSKTNRVEVGGRQLDVSNLDKVLWPETGTTKGEMLSYYARIAPVLVPHLTGRAITLKRFPDGVDGTSFFEKNCPSYKPPWMHTVKMGDVNYCLVDEPATVVWLANLAAIELHPTLAAKPDLGSPTSVVFDLDPGAPADVISCARVSLLIRELLAQLHLKAWVKTSGSKGLQLYVPLNSGATYEGTAPFAKAVAQLLEKRHPDLIVSYQQRAAREGKVLIDWSQNVESKTTVSVYSLRARPEPTVSTPVTWDELDDALSATEADRLCFEWEDVLDRVERGGDLMAEVLTLEQELPPLAAS
jgi:bifunctional non-homologous end joining protein LigD